MSNYEEPAPVQYFNSTGMSPESLAEKTTELIEMGFIFMYDHRGWLYFVKYQTQPVA